MEDRGQFCEDAEELDVSRLPEDESSSTHTLDRYLPVTSIRLQKLDEELSDEDFGTNVKKFSMGTHKPSVEPLKENAQRGCSLNEPYLLLAKLRSATSEFAGVYSAKRLKAEENRGLYITVGVLQDNLEVIFHCDGADHCIRCGHCDFGCDELANENHLSGTTELEQGATIRQLPALLLIALHLQPMNSTRSSIAEFSSAVELKPTEFNGVYGTGDGYVAIFDLDFDV